MTNSAHDMRASEIVNKVGRLGWAVRELAQHGRPRAVLSFPGGLGDSLMLSTLAREFKRRDAGKVWVMTGAPELFGGNKDVDRVLPLESERHIYFARRFQCPHIVPSYAPDILGRGWDTPPKRHILAEMCAQAGLQGPVDLRPYLWLDTEELRQGKRSDRQITFQVTGRSARYFMWTKEWYPERFQQVVEGLKGHFDIVQLGHITDPKLDGALDLRGKTTIRESAAILANSLLFVGLVGFLMHLARAVDCPSVIIYGGRELPSQSGYVCNENLVGTTACSPCWRYADCPGQRACMDQIQVGQVVAAIHRRLADSTRPLAIQEMVL